MIKIKFWGSFFLFSLFAINIFANSEIIFHADNEDINIGKNVEILTDAGHDLSPQEALESKNYEPSVTDVPNLGVSAHWHWVKFDLLNRSNRNTLYLKLNYPILDDLVLYTFSPDGELLDSIRMGEKYVYSQRLIDDPNFVFRLNIPPGEKRQFLLRVSSGEQIMLPLYVGTYQSVFEGLLTRNLLSGIYIGIMLIMFLYNLFIYFSVKDKSYLYYVGYILLVALTQITLKGYSFKFLWPDMPWLALKSVYLTGAMVGIASVVFVREFLNTRKNTPILDKLLIVVMVLDAGAIILALANFHNLSYNIINMIAGFGAILILVVAIIIYRSGNKSAKYFLAAWTIFLLSVVIYVLKDFIFIPYNLFTSYILEIGSALEAALLSFALADRINILKQEKEESQARSLRILKENERIIREQNVILEEKVEERTEELNRSNQDLSVTLNHLRDTQTQLVNSEKMASLGQLTAGIAHEINNPINFVVSNVKPLRRDVEDLLSILKKYDEIGEDEENISLKIMEVKKLKKELDEEYMLQEIDSLLDGIEEGANRTAEIIRGLRSFSRLDEDNLKQANVNEGLDSTLVLLRSSMKDEIDIEKNYSDDAIIECYPGKLNQVFMNILSNAIQAINSSDQKEENGKIVITTTSTERALQISIMDNGPGMPDHVKEHVFEPFFTTKDVGEGTGLGLSIAFSIIEGHHGMIQVRSAPGEGTEFIIELPRKITGY